MTRAQRTNAGYERIWEAKAVQDGIKARTEDLRQDPAWQGCDHYEHAGRSAGDSYAHLLNEAKFVVDPFGMARRKAKEALRANPNWSLADCLHYERGFAHQFKLVFKAVL